MTRWLVTALLSLTLAAPAQVYSPLVLKRGQPDASDLRRMAEGIYNQADAQTPRDRAEAIWRFFLTDGRFVKPGFWYHIAGWAYEEPSGEVLDPLKLMNSYGFGLCYQIAPVLEALWKAGGFPDARVWFVTGHTVAEVFYDGAYHHYDSDMMGYNTLGSGPALSSTVASVRQLERNRAIIESKLESPRKSNAALASSPWYPADVDAGAIGDLADLFSTTGDNWVFPFERAPQGHSMEFQLRPGELLTRYFAPERENAYYLPYRFDGNAWTEFPREIAEYDIRTAGGPRSQKDQRLWATGRIDYRPELAASDVQLWEVRSPYVIIDAEFRIKTSSGSGRDRVTLETSVDDGRTWTLAQAVPGPPNDGLLLVPAVLTRSAHGTRTAISGRYAYRVRVTATPGVKVEDVQSSTLIQLNPRTLPALAAGRNELIYSSGAPRVRRALVVEPEAARKVAHQSSNARYISGGAQGYWIPDGQGPAEFVFRLSAANGEGLTGASVGARFLDLSSGLAPDKLTAETRRVAPLASRHPVASIAWSASPQGPFLTVWEFAGKLNWLDRDPIDRTLLWPEVDRSIALTGETEIYVRYRVEDLAIDDFRVAVESVASGSSPVEITHRWTEDGARRSRTIRIQPGVRDFRYSIDIPAGVAVNNAVLAFECLRSGE